MQSLKEQEEARVAASFAGLAAGLVMAALFMAYSVGADKGLWDPFSAIAGFWIGPDSLAGEAFGLGGIDPEGSGAILLGVVTHLGISVGFGNGIGWMVGKDDSLVWALFSGLFSGVAIWAIMTFLLAPRGFSVPAAWIDSHPRWFWLGSHLLYGAVLGVLTPPIDRMIRG